MADFHQAMRDLNEKEGGAVNHHYDKGGQTYRGISRKYHPDWPGWALLDSGQSADSHVDHFYRENYWNPTKGAANPSQLIANEVFEQAVHQSPRIAARRLQRVLNAANKEGSRWADIVPDGAVGAKTLEALTAALQYNYEAEIWGMLNSLHGVYLLERIEDDPTQEAFAIGWFRRAMA